MVDLGYWFLMPFFYSPLSAFLLSLTLVLWFDGDQALIQSFLDQGVSPANGLPLWLQCVLILFIGDCFQYWIHRGFHTMRYWRWHAVHHSSPVVDWLSSVRFHPVNFICTITLVGLVTVWLGFSPQAFALLVPFNILYSSFVHANLPWHFGPFRYVLVSPVFHRWHHTTYEWGGNKNFATTFPILDVLFGTFYMPEHDRPEAHGFGIKERFPLGNFLRQLVWPFRVKGE